MKYYGRISDNKDLITKEYADGVVAVGNTQPTASQTKLWINPGQGGAGVEVPTVAEAKALGITGAQVGQAVIVNSVDVNGVPTAYTTGSGGGSILVTVTASDGDTIVATKGTDSVSVTLDGTTSAIMELPSLGIWTFENTTVHMTRTLNVYYYGLYELNIMGVIYGIYINGNESDPDTRVTYLEDAVGMTPAYMDFANGEFNWGSWENAFFVPKPCMLKYDGTVDYYLDPNDYTKKEDGTASHVADTSYGGNAMMEWGQGGNKIWYKIAPRDNNISADIYVANYQADDGYMAWSFINADGEWIDHFYTPIFNGSVDSNSCMRSMSGLAVSKSLTADVERTRCKANGDGWDTEVYADIVLINILLTLITKTTDSAAAIGQGLINDGTETINNGFRTGVHNDKGLFWGTSSGAAATYTNAVKVFGMENWWGFQWRRFCGLVNANGTIKYKMTHGTEDGSSASDYVVSTTASAYNGYLTGASVPANISGTYINQMTFNRHQFTPTAASGSASTYYCDGLWTNNNNQVDYAFRGGHSGYSARCGVWYLALNNASSGAYWAMGAAPSCKPLS